MLSGNLSRPQTGYNGVPSPPVQPWSRSSEHPDSHDGPSGLPAALEASTHVLWHGHTRPPSTQRSEAYTQYSGK